MHIHPQHIQLLAKTLVHHSCKVQPGERVWIESIDVDDSIVEAVAREVHQAGGIPLIQRKSQSIMRLLAEWYQAEDFDSLAKTELVGMERCQALIGLRAPLNIYDNQGISPEQRRLLLKHFIQPVHYDFRNQHLRWVYVRIPTAAMAQEARMPSQPFAERYFKAFDIEYGQLQEDLAPLADMINAAKEVRITHPNGTDLHFSLGGLGTYISTGEKNLPDGEIFTAPVRESVKGTLVTNIPSTYYGHHFPEISLRFDRGQVVEADAGRQTEALNAILDMDEGARYIGEFAFGVNAKISEPINDILFDEKMYGSVHFALGNAYPVADNGNRSAIHWDLILAQTDEYGGGKVFLDGKCIRENGHFLPPYLMPLNLPDTIFHSTH